MTYLAALLFPLGLLLPAPSSQPSASASAPRSANMMGDQQTLHRGAALELPAEQEITLDQIAASPERYASQRVRVRGTVATVCRVKGCWMGLRGERPTTTARVTFQGYSFFAPFDAVGKTATLEGTVQIKQLSLAERQHLAEDAQSDVSAIPEVELRLIASGVDFRAPTP